MALTTGSRVGPYEVTSQLGAGGMGVVYRARDTKLQRDVALKLLPDHFADDPDRLARFQREAQVLASLNHPHIAQIYGLEETENSRCIVMELVQGETLQERLSRGRIPIDEAVPIAQEIIEALESAHEHGIIHRDLKPANIKITPDGQVKVLDFGLAKAFESRQASNFSNSPTLMSGGGSVPGVILGTAAYMSPEQAKGVQTDHRSDIFSFGCVLYEMLTGTQAFSGETVSEILASVLKSEADFTLLPAQLPPRLRELLRRCLEKNPKNRWHAAADLRLQLQPAARDVIESAPAIQAVPLWKRLVPIALAAIIAAVLAGAAVWRLRPPTQVSVTRLTVVLPKTEPLDIAWRGIAISPDGNRIVYAANRQLYLRSISEFESKPIVGTQDVLSATAPVFSPNGRSIAFWAAAENAIKIVPVTGGSATTVARVSPVGLIGMTWSEYGIVFGNGFQSIMQVPESGGEPKVLIKANAPSEAVALPQMLPGGKAVLFVSTGVTPNSPMRIATQVLASGERKILAERASAGGWVLPRYIRTGHLLFFDGGLFAVPFDAQRLEISGDPVQVLQGIRGSNFEPLLGLAENGSLIYVPGGAGGRQSKDIALSDRNGVIERLKLPARPYAVPRVSPDGKRVAVEIEDNIWTFDLSRRTAPNRLTFGGKNYSPVWSPDGQRIAFQSDRDGDSAVFWQRADGTGVAERVTKPDKEVSHAPESWSNDALLYRATQGSQVSLWSYSMRDKKSSVFGGVQSVEPTYAVFSPDGKWVAYQVREVGKLVEIFVQPFPATGARYQLPISRDNHHAVWSRDGKQLFYTPGPGDFSVVDVTTTPAFSFNNPKRNPLKLETYAPAVPTPYDTTPDGKLIGLVPLEESDSGTPEIDQIQVVLNWIEELKQRVPTR